MSAASRLTSPPRGLYPILTDERLDLAAIPEAAAILAARGVSILQVRLKRISDRDALATHRAVAARLATWPGTLVINDRADLAALAARHAREQRHAHRIGLHLGQTDLFPAEARKIVGDEVVIGLSTHSIAQLERALADWHGVVDHLAFGPIFETTTKRDPDPVVGLDQLAAAARIAHAHERALVAIGGITLANAAPVLAAGADAIALAGALGAEASAITAQADALVRAIAQGRAA